MKSRQLWSVAQKSFEYYLKALALLSMKMEMRLHRQVRTQLGGAKQVPTPPFERRNEPIDRFISSSAVKNSRQQISVHSKKRVQLMRSRVRKELKIND